MQVGELIDALEPFRGRGDDVVLQVWTEHGFYDVPSKSVIASVNDVDFDGKKVTISGDAR